MPDRDNLKAVAAALAIAGAALFACSISPGQAHAQLPIPGAQIVSDPPVETATTDMDTVQEPGILTQTTTTATSVTTGEGAPNFTPINGYLGNLNNQLFSGINSGNFAQWFPGWVPLPTDSTVSVAIPLASTVLTTYNAAFVIAQSQGNALGSDNLAQIEQVSSSTTNLLAAVQANTDAVLAVAQELQLERQLLAKLITVEATKAGEEFNEKAREEATNARRWNLGVEPGQ
jgi:hypothetical protein